MHARPERMPKNAYTSTTHAKQNVNVQEDTLMSWLAQATSKPPMFCVGKRESKLFERAFWKNNVQM